MTQERLRDAAREALDGPRVSQKGPRLSKRSPGLTKRSQDEPRGHQMSQEDPHNEPRHTVEGIN